MRILRWNDHARVPDQLAHAANIGGDDGLRHRHRFADCKRHSFPGGTKDKAVSGIEERGHIAAQAKPVDGAIDLQFLRERFERCPLASPRVTGDP